MPTGSSLADEGKVVVAGHIVPLSTLMPDHNHAVLPRVEVVVWLVGPPVLKGLRRLQKALINAAKR